METEGGIGVRIKILACAMILGIAAAASAEDGQDAFHHRQDVMKQMGRALYRTVGGVAKGKAEFGPDTVAAAETIARLAPDIPTLFPPGSDVPDSNMKPAILAVPDKVKQLVAGVQAAMPGFVEDVKSGDKTRIASAYATMAKACDACHSEFRRQEK
jgi:cytochrome c556